MLADVGGLANSSGLKNSPTDRLGFATTSGATRGLGGQTAKGRLNAGGSKSHQHLVHLTKVVDFTLYIKNGLTGSK